MARQEDRELLPAILKKHRPSFYPACANAIALALLLKQQQIEPAGSVQA